MGLFRPYQSNDAADQPVDKAVTDREPSAAHQGKQSPTPSRREAELMRREQLRPTLSKRERKARERQVRREREEKALANLEMRPERVLIRNYVDSRWTFSEFSWPLLFLLMALFVAGTWWGQLAIWGSYGIWAVLLAVILEVAFLWMGFKRILAERVPDAPRRGLMMYMASRMVSMRRFRRPPTAIDRGSAF